MTGGGETRSPGRAGQTLHAVEAGGGEGEGTRAIASDWSFVQCPLILLQFQPFLSTGTDMSRVPSRCEMGDRGWAFFQGPLLVPSCLWSYQRLGWSVELVWLGSFRACWLSTVPWGVFQSPCPLGCVPDILCLRDPTGARAPVLRPALQEIPQTPGPWGPGHGMAV